MLGAVRSWLFGAPQPAPARGARHEASLDRKEDRNHWQFADGAGARDANDPGQRKTVRDRSDYETDHNGYLNGLVRQIANDLIGTGPRLQLTVEPEQRDAARRVERSFTRWCKATGFARKARLMERNRVVLGEMFAQVITNPKVRHPVKLDLFDIHPARVTGGYLRPDGRDEVDGIRFDAAGNPVSYRVLVQPANESFAATLATETLPAEAVVHWWRKDKPGQYRGFPETAPTLLVGAQLRRYGAAVLTAAEAAAMIAGVLKTNGTPPTDDSGNPSVQTMDEVALARGSFLALPDGWDASAFRAEQPATTYGDFSGNKLNEVSRPHLVPKNLITGDSSGFNFASGKLDHLPYQQSVWINRDEFRERVLDPVFLLWLEEATLAGEIPPGLPPYADWDWDWYWDGFASINPEKDAAAAEKRLALSLTTRQELCAEEGKDWEDVMTQQAKELARQRELEAEYGVTFPAPANAPAPAAPAATPEEAAVDQ